MMKYQAAHINMFMCCGLWIERRNPNSRFDYVIEDDAILAGVYVTKEAAAAASGDIDTEKYGTFDEALDPEKCWLVCEEFEDHRDDPPDDGVLIQIGGYPGERPTHDFIRLSIRKMPLLGAPSSFCNKKQKST